MDQGGYAFLLRFIESSHFSLFHCISYLERYSDELGIHFHLCQKLRSYPHDEIEFFIPQLVHLHVTVQTDSAALEDLILDLCNRSTHCAVLIFWQVQAHLTELSLEPESFGFQVCQRLTVKLQHILFNVGLPPDPKIRENIQPSFVLAASVFGGIGMPSMVSHIKPLVVSQGRRRRTHIFQIANKIVPNRVSTLSPLRHNNISAPGGIGSIDDDEQDLTLDSPASPRSMTMSGHSPSLGANGFYHSESETRSLPNLTLNSFRRVSSVKSLRPSSYSQLDQKKINILKSNYFRCETQFMTALQTISSRLVSVPRQARLSALRIEIAMLNKDLPAEVDIPLLIPNSRPTLNTPKFAPQKQHKLLRICPGEAVLLNSAERVPYLLLIEFLHNEFDFDPQSAANKPLLSEDLDRRHIFDTLTTGYTQNPTEEDEDESDPFPQEEKDMGDISVINLYDNKRDVTAQETLTASVTSISRYSNLITPEGNSPRSSDLSFSPAYSLPITESNDITDLATHMRTAAVMITQLDGAGSNKLPKEEVARIKARIIASMQSMEEHTIYRTDIMAGQAGERKMENDLKTTGMDEKKGKTNLGEEWLERKERIRKGSPFGHLPNWDLFSVIVKTGDDLRQEAFACQLIQAMQMCWEKAKSGVWVKKYNILITHNSAGLVETITNALSIHSIKKAITTESVDSGRNPKGAIVSLKEHFDMTFGKAGKRHERAVDCFVRSLASYSIICYILQIKDRHNGNILLDNEGHVNHIDFGFLLSNAPGGIGFETAPFKLTQEYVDIMGGQDSPAFQLFKDLLKRAFKDLRKEADSIIILVEMMQRGSSLPCFALGAATATMLRQRFQLQLSEVEVDAFVENVLIGKSLGAISTRLYDHYQLLTQGIYS